MSFDSSGGLKSNTAKNGKGKLKTKTESKTVVEANDARVALYVANAGAKDVSLALGATAVSGEGILLKKEGGGNQPVVITGYTGIVTAIASSEEPEIQFSEI